MAGKRTRAASEASGSDVESHHSQKRVRTTGDPASEDDHDLNQTDGDVIGLEEEEPEPEQDALNGEDEARYEEENGDRMMEKINKGAGKATGVGDIGRRVSRLLT